MFAQREEFMRDYSLIADCVSRFAVEHNVEYLAEVLLD